jgi:hypothetical protein
MYVQKQQDEPQMMNNSTHKAACRPSWLLHWMYRAGVAVQSGTALACSR